MSRMTDNDKHWGPFTVARWKNRFSLEWSSGGGHDDEPRNYLRLIAFGWAIRLWLPNILKPFGEMYDYHERTYGISLTTGGSGDGYDFLRVFLGPQTHDSRTTKQWSCFLPWKQWRHVRRSLYADTGKLWASFSDRDRRSKKWTWNDEYKAKEECPKLHFGFEDYDGEMIIATTCIEEREWHFGEGWFKWLSFFRKPLIRRSLDLRFNEEVGPEKGSWKGGTTGHGIEMLPGEMHEAAFKRYCAEERDARRGRKYRIKYIGPCGPPPPRPKPVEPENDCVQVANSAKV